MIYIDFLILFAIIYIHKQCNQPLRSFMKRILTTTILAAFALTACSQPDNTPVAQNWNNSSPEVANNINCEPQKVNGQMVVPVECNMQNTTEYDRDYYNTNHHYHNTANTAAAVAGGAVAGVAGKMAYDKYKANKQAQATRQITPNNTARANAPTSIPPSRSVDLSKQSFKPSTTKSSYTSPSSKRSFKSKSKRR